jgi:tetratricopeptide (TPR) repeat protein
MALANVAWILASAGKKVLVADWDLEAPGLDRFFAPFLPIGRAADLPGVIDMVRAYEDYVTTSPVDRSEGWLQGLASVTPLIVPIRWSFPGEGSLHLLTAGRQNAIYSASLAGLDWDTFYERLGGADFLDTLAEGMRADYDYTLIDSRTGLSDVADICTLHLPDVLVDCYTLSDQGIDGAATVARKVAVESRRGGPDRPVRILPVAMRVDDGEKQKLDAGRTQAMRRFPDLPAGMSEDERTRYFLDVEVPYQTFYAYEETLATFFEEPAAKQGLLAAYQRLTGFLTDGEVTAMPAMDDAERERWQRRFSRSARPEQPPTRVRYAARDQVWAEWVIAVLNAHEIEVTDEGPVEAAEELPPTFDTVLTVVSANYLALRTGSAGPDLWLRPPHLILVVDEARLPPQSAVRSSIAGLGPEAARSRLLSLVGLTPGAAGEPEEAGIRYPGVLSPWFAAPTRNDRFTGRITDLQQLRDQLRADRRAVVVQAPPVALHGLGGVGKTQLALEYVHRFRADYDVVWWIDASQTQFVDAALIDLGRRLKLVTVASVDAAQVTLDGLKSGALSDRWLLVYDNAEDPDAIKDLMPTEGPGHLLITSRNRDWEKQAQTLPVDVFRRAESVSHLRGRYPALSHEQAEQVAGTLGDLPIAVAAAGAFLAETGMPVADYLTLIRSGAGQPRLPGEAATERTWDLSLERLQDQSPGGHRLLQVCSVLATDISLDLLYSDGLMAAVTGADPAAGERAMRPALVHSINRLALLKLDTQSRQVQVHRLLQEAVRRRMSTTEQKDTQHQVHLALAKFRPSGDPDDPATWDQYRIIWRHLRISGAEECDAEVVRELVVARVRYMWRRGDFERGRVLGLRVAGHWEGLLGRIAGTGDEPPVTDIAPLPLRRHLLELRFNIANILRDQADFEGALALDGQVLDEQRELLGEDHPNTLRTMGSYAADLRALGRYREALPLAEANNQAWQDRFGETDLRTLASANNLAEALRTVGDFGQAMAIDEDVYARRVELLGPYHPDTLHSQAALGRDHREAGEYRESVDLLRSVVTLSSEHLGELALGTLNAQVSLAASLRGLGQATEAGELLETAYDALTRRFQPDNPSTLACRLTRAGNLLSLGEGVRAVDEMRAVTHAYRSKLGEDHPFSLVCANNQAAALRWNRETAEALRMAQLAAQKCETHLGQSHPHSLAAAMNEAACLFDLGEVGRAGDAMRRTADLMEAALGPRHPDFLLCRANLAVITASQPGDEAVEALQERMGDEHPAIRELLAGRVVYRVTDPQEPF